MQGRDVGGRGVETCRRALRSGLPLALSLTLLAGSGCTPAYGPPPAHGPPSTEPLQDLQTQILVRPLPGAEALPKLPAERTASLYRIGPLDELIITVWGRPDLGSQIPVARDSRRNISIVQEDGTIGLPFVGNINVGGLTVQQAQAHIEDLYSRTVEAVQVDVLIATFRSKVVLLEGAFQRERRLFLSDDVRTVGDAINSAGGLLSAAQTTLGVLVRGGREYRLNYRKSQEGRSDVHRVLLEGGDKIYFPPFNERLVYVFGEVGLQGAIPIPPKGLALVEALAIARGPDVITANAGKLFLMRQAGPEATVYQFTLDEALRSPDLQLRPGDRIYVPPTMIAQWDRFWRQALPFFTTAASATNVPADLAGARRNILAD